MKYSLFACAAAVLAFSSTACADGQASFENDGKSVLSLQPGLIEYVDEHFQVKDAGIAKEAGNQEQPPQPPFIFHARVKGSSGPYNIRLLVQPGTPGHILGIYKDSNTASAPVASAPQQPVMTGNAPVTTAPVNGSQPPALTSDTPTGAINDSSKVPNLAPPADPAPTPTPSH
jgi:hypothetical protein